MSQSKRWNLIPKYEDKHMEHKICAEACAKVIKAADELLP